MECANSDCRERIKKPRLCPSCRTRSYCSQQCRLSDWYAGHQITCGLREVQKVVQFSLAEFIEEKNEEESILGKGSFGEVHLVTHQPTGQKYALKSISKMSLQRSGQLSALKREIAIHKNLSHPNIIRLLDHFEDQNKVHLLLELANRGSLFYEIHRQERLPEDLIRRYFLQACLGIRYLHENNIIHRDLKPENMLLDSENNIKICDFGWCARSTETRTTFCGTLEYMAPEMILGGAQTKAIDIWALGVLLFEMTHGRAPFAARNDSEKCQQILTLSYKTDPELPASLCDLIRYMLKTTPEDRPPIVSVLAHPWVTSSSACEVKVGLKARKLTGDAWLGGEVVAVREGDCWLQFQGEDKPLCLAVDFALKVMLRNGGNLDIETPSKHERNLSFIRAKEDELLRNIDDWCRTPKFVGTKSTLISELDAANRRAEESIAALQKQEQGETVEIRAPDTVIVRENVPVEEAGWNATGIALETPSSVPAATPSDFGGSRHAYELPCTPMDELFTEVFSPIPVLCPTAPQPEIEKTQQKNLPISDLISEENSDVDKSPGGARSVSQLFERERDIIDSKSKDFYQKVEHKWVSRNSQGSVIEAPAEPQSPVPPARRESKVIEEIEKLQSETRRPLPELLLSKTKSEDYIKMNKELEMRKQRISELLNSADFHRSVSARSERPRHPKEDGGFFKWLGSVLGCTNR